MIVYHGTTSKNARRIRVVGFLPRKARIWFTTSQGIREPTGEDQGEAVERSTRYAEV